MEDAATRFYSASHKLHLEGNTADAAGSYDSSDKSLRYYGAIQEIKNRRPTAVCELGYGRPGSVRAIAPLVAGEYCILDIIDRTLQVELPENVRMHVCNLDNKFPLSDASFDFIVAMMIVEHLYDPFHTFSELCRIARKGATLAINLPNIASLKCRLELLMGKMPITSVANWFELREWDGNHLHYFTVADTKRLAALYGFKLVKIYPVGRGLALKRLRPSLFCHEITYIFEKE